MEGTILVADDDRTIRTVLAQALTRAGCRVRATGTATTLWRWIEEGEGDVVVTDVMMPDGDALDLLPAIRKRRPELPVIVMSAQNTVMTAIRAAEVGAYEYLPKPFDLKEVLGQVAKALNHKTRRAPQPEEENARREDNLPLIGRSPAMQEVYRILARLMNTDLGVMITGESGTGKELVARALHNYGLRKAGPFVAINMAAIPRDLIESELFGHEKGAFTGATQMRRGKFELADGGTLFLDEVGDMNPGAQAKVLRVLQEGELERVGGHDTIKVDVRVLAATNKDLAAEIAAGRFREDLYYRLNVVPIEVPPLREHKEDIPALVEHFLRQTCAANDRRKKTMTESGITLLMQYDWPGNVREQRNSIERLVILTGDAAVLRAEDVQDILPGVKAVKTAYTRGTALKDLVAAAERDLVLAALEANHHHIANTARELGLERSHLYKKMKALGIFREPGRDKDEPGPE
jgi:two-component system nitrogen regulation response regulator GlnG